MSVRAGVVSVSDVLCNLKEKKCKNRAERIQFSTGAEAIKILGRIETNTGAPQTPDGSRVSAAG
jgi:uncharacterized hydantoinase/oxoprolinase family protein